jgi:diguanylate cyclase (GGDEF)-like protein/putative nucleotidyltransferase with HDIG domain
VFSVESDRTLMARSLVYVYAAGATLTLVSALTIPAASHNQTMAAAAAGYAFALLLTAFDRMPVWALQLCLAGGSLLTEWVVSATHGTSPIYTVFYFWIAIYAFYFFRPMQAAGQIVFIFVSYALVVGLVKDPTSPAAVGWMLTTAALVVAGAMIGVLKHRIDGILEDARNSARTDGLTGLRNRRAFEELLATELGRSERNNGRFSLIIADLDRFKSLNDSYGHQEGDRALARVAGCLEEGGRLGDVVARIGGEEFAIILPDANEREAYLGAERLRKRVGEACSGEPGELTISLGIATYPHHGDNASALMRAADQALYVAKEIGRNRSVIFNTAAVETVSAAIQHKGVDDEKHLATVMALAEVLDIRDAGTAAHSQTVGKLAEAIAQELGMPEDRCERLRYAGTVHDIGKIGVADSILRKPGALEMDEMTEMRKHPEVGARILAGADLEDISSWVLAHHERPDGGGYPFGLAGDQIPLEGRILAVADAYEAMTNGRVYQPAITPQDARAELLRCSGTQFDDRVVEAFLRLPEQAPVLAPDSPPMDVPSEATEVA